MSRRWILWLLGLAFIWLVISRRAEVGQLALTAGQSVWEWLLVAALLQVVYYLVFTAIYWSAFDTVQVSSRLRDLAPVVMASVFVNVVAPTAGTSGAALFVDDLARRGQSATRAAAGTLLALVADLGAFLIVLVAGMGELLLRHDLTLLELSAAIILVVLVASLTAVLLSGLWRPLWLRGVLDRVERASAWLAQRFGRRTWLRQGWAEENAAEFTRAGAAIGGQPRRLARTFGLAWIAHLVDLASLYAVCLAFRQPVSLGVLLAAYAIGVLFWVVALTPQGIGVVEGMMVLAFTSLGVPIHPATAIALTFRGLTFWLPLGIGFLVVRRLKLFETPPRPDSEAWKVHTVAVLTALMGLVNILSAVTPAMRSRLLVLRQYMPLEVRQGGHLAAALAGFGLILLAYSLWRRKRLAWILTLIVLGLSAVGHLVKGLDYEEAVLAGLLGVWLFTLRDHFHARSDPPSIRQALGVLLAAGVFTLVYGTTGFYLLDRHYSVNFSLPAAVRQTFVMFTQFGDPGLVPLTGFGRYFADSIYLVAIGTVGYAVLLLLRPVLVRWPSSAEERARAEKIVTAYGQSTLARFALFNDKSYFFTTGGSLVAFVVKGRAALALGDPIGPADDAAAAIGGFQELCRRNDWMPAFYQVLPDYLPLYQQAGFRTLPIGREAIVDLNRFTLEGSENKALRNALSRLKRLGYEARAYEPPLSDSLIERLRAVSDEWLTLVKGSEKRFSLGWFDDAYVRGCVVMAAESQEGVVTAFANVIPEYRRPEVSVDMMRHSRQAPSGTMDFLFLSLFDWARARGYATFNLGLSSLAGIGERSEDPAIERALHYVFQHINQFYNFKGLNDFKEKFHPEWSPRSLVYPGVANLPTIMAGLVQADSGAASWRSYLRR